MGDKMTNTIGMILCGGFGKRLRPITETVPKPLIEIKEDYTILDKQLFDFKNAGVNQVYLLTGFLSDKIHDRFGDEYLGVKIEYVEEDKPLGTLNAIKLGMEAVGDNKQCVIRNGDVVADLNIKKMIEQGEKSDHPLSIFITRMVSPYGIVEISGDRLVSFKEKPVLTIILMEEFIFLKENWTSETLMWETLKKLSSPCMPKTTSWATTRKTDYSGWP